MKPTVALITIGDELLYGHTEDTNARWMSTELALLGMEVIQKTTIGDNKEAIWQALSTSIKQANVVLITGGLGPTKDDVTKSSLAAFFNSKLIINQVVLKHLTQLFDQHGRTLTEKNKSQALLPEKCIPILNTEGTAPGMWFLYGQKVVVAMPGVPHEMKKMMKQDVLQRLVVHIKPSQLFHFTIRTVGISESQLSDKIARWEETLPSFFRLAYLPTLGEVKIRLTGKGLTMQQMEKECMRQVDKLKSLIGSYIYGYGKESLVEVVGNLLRLKKYTLAVAESCTGGFLSHLITSVPGSSDYFLGSVVTYANSAKMEVLGVDPHVLEQQGAVSESAVAEMASGVRDLFQSSIGIALSGIAGPGGGSHDKPVGLIWMGYCDGTHTETKQLNFQFDRLSVIRLASVVALNKIWRKIHSQSP